MYCLCGCGGVTSIAKKTRTKLGHVKGEHVPFLCGHHRRIWNRYIVDDNGCWIFTGYIGKTGYGEWYFGGEKSAHRAMYVKHKGLIPDGLVIDHLCSIRSCVNPDHLEAVSQEENNRRTWERGNHPCAYNRTEDGSFASWK